MQCDRILVAVHLDWMVGIVLGCARNRLCAVLAEEFSIGVMSLRLFFPLFTFTKDPAVVDNGDIRVGPFGCGSPSSASSLMIVAYLTLLDWWIAVGQGCRLKA
jgi:hypothetical protein